MHLFLGAIGSIAGLVISLYIRAQKKKKKKLVCPRMGSCDKVVHSMYSKTLGIPNEFLGISFYAVLAALYCSAIVYPPLMTDFISWLITVMTISGVLFSAYLIGLQALVIRAWCMWCLGSAIATVVLVIALFGLDNNKNFFELLASQENAWSILRDVGLLIGVTFSTIGEMVFLRFLRDGKISLKEKKIMDMFSALVWLGLAILVLSGTMLYLPNQSVLHDSPVFIFKTIIVGSLIIVGLLLYMLVAPKMRRFSFEKSKPARYFRRLAFALTGISIVTWYVAFGLNLFDNIDIALRESIALYLAMVITTVIATNTYESIISQRK